MMNVEKLQHELTLIQKAIATVQPREKTDAEKLLESQQHLLEEATENMTVQECALFERRLASAHARCGSTVCKGDVLEMTSSALSFCACAKSCQSKARLFCFSYSSSIDCDSARALLLGQYLKQTFKIPWIPESLLQLTLWNHKELELPPSCAFVPHLASS